MNMKLLKDILNNVNIQNLIGDDQIPIKKIVFDSKKCTKCNLVKPVADFTKNVWSKDNHSPVCTDCQHVYYDKLSNRPKIKVDFKMFDMQNK